MNLKDQPLRRIIQIMKGAAEGARDRQSERDKSDQCTNVTEMIQEVVFDHIAPEDRKKLKFATPDLEYKALYEKINRMMHRDLKSTARGSKPMDDLNEVCGLLTIGIKHNVKKLFNNTEKRAIAIELIDKELKLVSTQVKQLKQSKDKQAKLSVQPQAEGGNTIVNVMKMMEELNDLYDILNQAEESVPEFVEDHIWDEEYEKLIVVRNRERFVLKGEERVVVYSILETPTTHNVHLIRFGSDYWQGAETSFDLNEDAFFIQPYASMAETVAEIINAINLERDLELGLMGDIKTSLYDTYSSLNKKLSVLLA